MCGWGRGGGGGWTTFQGPYLVGEAAFSGRLTSGPGAAFPEETAQNVGFGSGSALERYRVAERAMPCLGPALELR